MKGLSKTRLKNFLKTYDYPIREPADVDLAFTIPRESGYLAIPIDISFCILKGNLLQVHGFSEEVSLPSAKNGAAVLFCNDWNSTGDEIASPFGRALFLKASNSIAIDYCLPLDHEIDDQELGDFLFRVFQSFRVFFNKAAEVFGW